MPSALDAGDPTLPQDTEQGATRPPAQAGGRLMVLADIFGRAGVKGALRRPAAALDPDPPVERE